MVWNPTWRTSRVWRDQSISHLSALIREWLHRKFIFLVGVSRSPSHSSVRILFIEPVGNTSRPCSNRMAWGHLCDIRPWRNPFLAWFWILSSLNSIPFPEVILLIFQTYSTRIKYFWLKQPNAVLEDAWTHMGYVSKTLRQYNSVFIHSLKV